MKTVLLCEYMKDPVGIGTPGPVLTWYAADPAFRSAGTRVTVYRDGHTLWDAAFPAGVCRAVYAGEPLESGRTYRWRAEITGADGTAAAGEARFTAGLLAPDAWRSPWVGGIRIDCGCYMYRHEFTAAKPLKSAAASTETFRGTVAFRWERADGGIRWEATVPDGCTGIVCPPDGGLPYTVGAGVTAGKF